ncbi:MAG: ferredoxin family protein [Clostridiales bacterium]|nr:ferredoxin family protein [Clostridiales bacterium]MCD8128228.1 ferredoxin family protein [Oscillospiraceae bacterium]
MPPIINKDKCTGCKTCVKVCSLDVFGWQEPEWKYPHIQYPDECWHCNACVQDCPVQAIRLRVPLPSMMVFMEPIATPHK